MAQPKFVVDPTVGLSVKVICNRSVSPAVLSAVVSLGLVVSVTLKVGWVTPEPPPVQTTVGAAENSTQSPVVALLSVPPEGKTGMLIESPLTQVCEVVPAVTVPVSESWKAQDWPGWLALLATIGLANPPPMRKIELRANGVAVSVAEAVPASPRVTPSTLTTASIAEARTPSVRWGRGLCRIFTCCLLRRPHDDRLAAPSCALPLPGSPSATTSHRAARTIGECPRLDNLPTSPVRSPDLGQPALAHRSRQGGHHVRADRQRAAEDHPGGPRSQGGQVGKDLCGQRGARVHDEQWPGSPAGCHVDPAAQGVGEGGRGGRPEQGGMGEEGGGNRRRGRVQVGPVDRGGPGVGPGSSQRAADGVAGVPGVGGQVGRGLGGLGRAVGEQDRRVAGDGRWDRGQGVVEAEPGGLLTLAEADRPASTRQLTSCPSCLATSPVPDLPLSTTAPRSVSKVRQREWRGPKAPPLLSASGSASLATPGRWR